MKGFPLYSHEYFMAKALQEAQKAMEQNEVPVGAVVVCEEKIIGKGFNQTELLKDVTAHAEMIALSAAHEKFGGKFLKQATLYVTLEPCFMCAGASYWYQIGRIIYGASDSKRGFGNAKGRVLHPTTELLGGILEKECAALLSIFFKNLRQEQSK